MLMRLRGQKSSGSEFGRDGAEKEGGGRRGKEREKNLLASIARSQSQLLAAFSQPGPPLSPPRALGSPPPAKPIALLLAPAATLVNQPSLSFSINLLLCELASSAYYLEVGPLVDLTCQRLADSIQGKSPEEIRTTFNITNDFTPGEEEQVGKRVLERTMRLPVEAVHEARGLSAAAGEAALREEEERGLMAGLNAGLNGTVGVREKLKVRLAEKRLHQLQEELSAEAGDDVPEAAIAHRESDHVAGDAPAVTSAAKKKKKKKSTPRTRDSHGRHPPIRKP